MDEKEDKRQLTSMTGKRGEKTIGIRARQKGSKALRAFVKTLREAQKKQRRGTVRLVSPPNVHTPFWQAIAIENIVDKAKCRLKCGAYSKKSHGKCVTGSKSKLFNAPPPTLSEFVLLRREAHRIAKRPNIRAVKAPVRFARHPDAAGHDLCDKNAPFLSSGTNSL